MPELCSKEAHSKDVGKSTTRHKFSAAHEFRNES